MVFSPTHSGNLNICVGLNRIDPAAKGVGGRFQCSKFMMIMHLDLKNQMGYRTNSSNCFIIIYNLDIMVDKQSDNDNHGDQLNPNNDEYQGD